MGCAIGMDSCGQGCSAPVWGGFGWGSCSAWRLLAELGALDELRAMTKNDLKASLKLLRIFSVVENTYLIQILTFKTAARGMGARLSTRSPPNPVP